MTDEQIEALVQSKTAPLYERLVNMENQLQKVVDLITAAGEAPEVEEPDGDLLDLEKGWIEEERDKSRVTRQAEGRAPFK